MVLEQTIELAKSSGLYGSDERVRGRVIVRPRQSLRVREIQVALCTTIGPTSGDENDVAEGVQPGDRCRLWERDLDRHWPALGRQEIDFELEHCPPYPFLGRLLTSRFVVRSLLNTDGGQFVERVPITVDAPEARVEPMPWDEENRPRLWASRTPPTALRFGEPRVAVHHCVADPRAGYRADGQTVLPIEVRVGGPVTRVTADVVVAEVIARGRRRHRLGGATATLLAQGEPSVFSGCIRVTPLLGLPRAMWIGERRNAHVLRYGLLWVLEVRVERPSPWSTQTVVEPLRARPRGEAPS